MVRAEVGGVDQGAEQLGGRECLGGVFALVAYIPEPLASFLNGLRCRLTPSARPRAHVTVLPPRPYCLGCTLQETVDALAATLGSAEPVRIRLGEVAVFEASRVVYLEVEIGAGGLADLHQLTGVGALAFAEPFPYHPHVTLAQPLDLDRFVRGSFAPGSFAQGSSSDFDPVSLAAIARQQWAGYDGPREFLATKLSFVRQAARPVGASDWEDLAFFQLGKKAT